MTHAPAPENQPAVPARGTFLRRTLLALGLLLACAGAFTGYDAYTFLRTPASTEPKEVFIDIQPGATFDRVAWDLYKLGAIADVTRFRILAKYRNKLGSVQAGEFAVNTGWTPERVLDHLTSGRAVLYRLALREGLPWWETAHLVEQAGFAKASEFEAVIHDPEFLRRHGIPFANAEGFLYPETYLLRKPKQLGGREQAEAVARILVQTFWERTWPALARYAAADSDAARGTPLPLPDFTLKSDIPVRVPPRAAPAGEAPAPPPLHAPVSAETLRYLVILASLVEKETGVAAERARVAGVYANRMRLGMLLQCDPTIIYGIGASFTGRIRKSQLEDARNPYNTYKHPGLPPGPICSPGAAATQAAVAPEDHKYLYFVATGDADGTHTFSTTLRDHEKAVRAYRATQRRQR